MSELLPKNTNTPEQEQPESGKPPEKRWLAGNIIKEFAEDQTLLKEYLQQALEKGAKELVENHILLLKEAIILRATKKLGNLADPQLLEALRHSVDEQLLGEAFFHLGDFVDEMFPSETRKTEIKLGIKEKEESKPPFLDNKRIASGEVEDK